MLMPGHQGTNQRKRSKVNDNKKDFITLVMCFFLGVSVTLAITIPIYITVFRRANNKSIELSNKLSEVNRRLSDATTTITDCRESAERITEAARTGNDTLTGIIDSLKRIRDEVQVLEERLSDFDNSSSNNHRNDSVADIPVD